MKYIPSGLDQLSAKSQTVGNLGIYYKEIEVEYFSFFGKIPIRIPKKRKSIKPVILHCSFQRVPWRTSFSQTWSGHLLSSVSRTLSNTSTLTKIKLFFHNKLLSCGFQTNKQTNKQKNRQNCFFLLNPVTLPLHTLSFKGYCCFKSMKIPLLHELWLLLFQLPFTWEQYLFLKLFNVSNAMQAQTLPLAETSRIWNDMTSSS